MNVRDLIEALSQCDPDARVVVAGYENGFNDISQVKPCEIRLNVYQDWFYGSHADAQDHQIQQLMPNAPVVQAVALTGENQNANGVTTLELMA